MSDKSTSSPYEPLGSKLRALRELHSESVAEVSGAVEIDEAALAHIESGKDRPSEDILLLLINHFNLADERAEELWELAGYSHSHGKHSDSDGDDFKQKTAAMMIMLDPRVMYSDSVEVVSNQQGVVMNFSQTAAAENPALTIARIGMSYDQAKAVMGILHQVLYNHDNPGNGRRLHGGDTQKD
ncbi:helix-turn-helix domain-containing protein [Candidatus Saccharibacteria bacterium]|nr:helix-turn-helix domain-containing protein [Candidatus Saccharibacteria bacterium]